MWEKKFVLKNSWNKLNNLNVKFESLYQSNYLNLFKNLQNQFPIVRISGLFRVVLFYILSYARL